MSSQSYLRFADLVLIAHFAYVAFVVLGLLVIWVGYFRRWDFVRTCWFRGAHLLTITVVAAEALFGVVCPLTVWENKLRLLAGGGERYQGSFVEHWLHRVMFFHAEGWIFTVAYVVFFIAVAASLWVVKPKWPARQKPD